MTRYTTEATGARKPVSEAVLAPLTGFLRVPADGPELLLDKGVQVASSDSKRFQRLEKRKAWNDSIAQRLEEIGEKVLAGRLRSCQTYVERRRFRLPDGSATYRHNGSERCQCRLCQPCASRRASRTAHKYEQALAQFSQGKAGHHLVLTLRNADHLPDRKLLSKWLRNLWRKKVWKQYGGIAGGLYSIETTWNAEQGQYHAHVHCLIFTPYDIPHFTNGRRFWTQDANQQIADAWLSITKEHFIVRGQQWNGRIQEMLKYIAKGSEIVVMPNEALREYIAWTHRQRMLSSFGKLYGLASQIEREIAMEEEQEQQELELDCDEYVQSTTEAVLEEIVVMKWDASKRRYLVQSVETMNQKEQVRTYGARQILQRC